MAVVTAVAAPGEDGDSSGLGNSKKEVRVYTHALVMPIPGSPHVYVIGYAAEVQPGQLAGYNWCYVRRLGMPHGAEYGHIESSQLRPLESLRLSSGGSGSSTGASTISSSSSGAETTTVGNTADPLVAPLTDQIISGLETLCWLLAIDSDANASSSSHDDDDTASGRAA